MSLEDLLGRTYEIRIIDFLAENMKFSYNQSEISDFTGISRSVLYRKLPEMVKKELLTIDGQAGKNKTYRLAGNDIIKKLVATAFEYSFMLSKMEDDELNIDESGLESPAVQMENRYYKPAAQHVYPEYDGPFKEEKRVPAESASSA